MDFRTEVEIEPPGFRIGLRQKVVFAGSCFAENVGRGLQESKLDCRVNPFGVLYNPESLAAWLRLVAAPATSPEDIPVFESGGLWHCWLTDSSFSAPTEHECRERVVRAIEEVRADLPRMSCLFLTLGTNRCYHLRGERWAVGNCHKQPGDRFVEDALSTEQVAGVLMQVLGALWQGVAPQLRVVFTVSPYRYAKYGFHGSRLGKAALLLGVDEVCRRFPDRCFYFPAYEIVLDELRDYRFYADDMLHPSPRAAQFIRERFAETYLDEDTRRFLERWQRMKKALEHRPLHPGTEAERNFLQATLARLDALARQYPYLSFADERNGLRNRLQNQ